MRTELPTGTVTFVFTDVDGSTSLLAELGAEQYADALAAHRVAIREACTDNGGVEVDTQGDAFFFAFPTAPGALAAASEFTERLPQDGPIRVRVGVHTGTPFIGHEGYVGHDVHRAARIAAAAHGGQVLVSASTAALLDADLTDLGEHRFKDLIAAERVYQLGDVKFPPLETLHQTNLPIPSTPFVGRVQELGEVLELLSRKDVRLLTLTGTGGTGKTRLAAQAAAELAPSYPHGVWWVPLAPLRDPELVLATAGQALGSKNGLAKHIADKRLLLLFDNFEHVVGAAADLAALLASCPHLELLVTSREPLHVMSEQEYAVPPFVHEEGVSFFMARARAVEPDFPAGEAVPEICRRLDELPLALELAAARVKVLSPEQILARLDQRLPLLTGGARDAPERQRTLRATIEWSYGLLSEEEQRLFVRLSVFAGGCTLEAAEDVAKADVDVLQSLVDKSLLRHTSERFWMLETISEYAAERLDEAGEVDALQRRHAEHFLALAEKAEPNLLVSGGSSEWLDRLEREHDNLRAAFDRLEVAGESEHALRLAGALARFWYLRGHVAEGRRRLEGTLGASVTPTAAHAKALSGAAVMALESGDAMTTSLRAEEGLAVYSGLGDAWGAAHSRFLLGHAALDQGDSATAQQLFRESRRGFRELGDEHYTLLATYNLAVVIEALGDLERARALQEDCLRRAREQSDDRIVAYSLDQLASYARDEGRVEDALAMLAESLRIRCALDDPVAIAENLGRVASTFVVAGMAGTAALLLSSSEALREQIGSSSVPSVAKMNEGTLTAIRTQLDEAAFAEAWERGRTLTLDEAVAVAFDF